MNHLLHQISWHQYLTVVIIAAIIYYLVLILRCYRPELQNLQRRFVGDKSANQLQVLQYQSTGEEVPAASTQSLNAQAYSEKSICESDVLATQLKASIAKAADKPFAPALLISQLKQILQEHQHIAAAARPDVNRLIVNECKKNGTALLTEEEVDQWWER
jgi:hypothetical protein